VTDPKWYERTGTPITREGIVPFYRYVIREKGNMELGILSCSMCHTRIMPDGSTVKGAQGNSPFNRTFAEDYRSDPSSIVTDRLLEKLLYHTPWLRPDPQAGLNNMTGEQLAAPHETVPAGVLIRHRSRHDQPVQVPDLIGVKTRPFLDRSGLQRHRGIADLMRYAALNQRGDDLSDYGGFIPQGTFTGGKLPPDPSIPDARLFRYSDEQLYALALFAYSLKPPPNPNLPKTAEERALVKRGEAIFNDPVNSCYKCHDPKQGYTNNKLIAAPGFEPPANHPAQDDIMRNASGTPRRIGTDPGLTVTTRRGTGFYKVPSLQGVWYHGPFEHNGSVATLEDWFDPRRIQDDYVPTGWKGPPGTKTRAVKGHEFGLDLSEVDEAPLRDARADRPRPRRRRRRLYQPVSGLGPKSFLTLEIGDFAPFCTNPRSGPQWAKPRSETPDPIAHDVADGDCTDPFGGGGLTRCWAWRSVVRVLCGLSEAAFPSALDAASMTPEYGELEESRSCCEVKGGS